ncbi:MAG: hypothetical protein QW767_06675 [Thermoprotei archaeon]
MKLTMFRAMGIGLAAAALLLVWEELEVTLHGTATFAQTAGFTVFSLAALAVFAAAVLKAPDN